MLGLVLAVAAVAGPPRCLSADAAAALGFPREALDQKHKPALELWPDDEGAVGSAWQEFTRPLRQTDAVTSLSAYFSADGAVKLIVVNGQAEVVMTTCEALRARGDYRWPLHADRPFRQCGSVMGSSGDGTSPFQLQVDKALVEVCSKSPIRVVVSLHNRSLTKQQVWLPTSGTINDDVSISLVVEGEEVPLQLFDPTATGRSVVALGSIEPDGRIDGAIDLGPYQLPSGAKLGDTPGRYVLYADVLKQGSGGAWSGIVWSKPFEVVVQNCE